MNLMIFYIVTFLILIIFLFQDLKFRGINWFLFPLLLGITLFLNPSQLSPSYTQMLMSILFLTVNLLVLFIYVSLKNKRLINIFKTHFGIGDVLFFIAVIPLFSFRNFILFFITGMIVSMVLHLLLKHKQKKITIPLAGYLSAYLILILTINIFKPNFLLIDVF